MKPLVLFAAMLCASQAAAHDIYTKLIGKSGISCCGGESAGRYRDCWPTVYRERGAGFQFRLQSGDWVDVPSDSIQFVPLPGDADDGASHRAHLCYRDLPARGENDVHYGAVLNTLGGASIAFFCAFIPPGRF